MANQSAANVLMAGSASDSLYLGPAGTNLSTIVDLTTTVPAGLVDVGWLSEDGLSLDLSDSVEKLRGHQGHGVVKTYMSDSSTTLTATLLESKVATLQNFFNATIAQSGTVPNKVATATIPAARKVIRLAGVVDIVDTSDSAVKVRMVFPTLELGERDSVAFKYGEMVAYKYTLEVIGSFNLISNAPGLVTV